MIMKLPSSFHHFCHLDQSQRIDFEPETLLAKEKSSTVPCLFGVGDRHKTSELTSHHWRVENWPVPIDDGLSIQHL